MSEEYSVAYYQAWWNTPMDATPPAAQRQWVGLTDEDIYDCFSNDVKTAMRNVEQTLKEKNT